MEKILRLNTIDNVFDEFVTFGYECLFYYVNAGYEEFYFVLVHNTTC